MIYLIYEGKQYNNNISILKFYHTKHFIENN